MSIPQRACLSRMTPYVPGRSGPEGAGARVLLASNENPLGPSPRALEAMREAIGQGHRYPDMRCAVLAARLGELWDLPVESVAVGSGSTHIMQLLARAFVNPGDEAIVSPPTFAALRGAVVSMDGVVREVPLLDDAQPDFTAVAAACNERTRMVYICNPNNPTGTLVDPDALANLLDDLPHGVLAVLDEAYAEYVDDPRFRSGRERIDRSPRLVVLRTFSKIYGLAGLRVGYALGHPDLILPLKRVAEPFAVSAPAQAAAVAALDDGAHVQASRSLNRGERVRLTGRLRSLRCRVWPSEANFVWTDVGAPAADAQAFLLQRGVLARPGTQWRRPRHFRLTVGTSAENDELLAGLSDFLALARDSGGAVPAV